MKYYNLMCEVPGGIGEETIYDKSEIPWQIKKLHLEFEGWLGADILVSSSVVVITSKMQKSLGFNFSGILGYENFYCEKTETFKILQPEVELPKFERILIGDNPFVDDFALTHYNDLYNQLIISERARIFLADFNLGNYSILTGLKRTTKSPQLQLPFG